MTYRSETIITLIFQQTYFFATSLRHIQSFTDIFRNGCIKIILIIPLIILYYLYSVFKNAMMPNGAICSSTPSMLSSPGPQGPMPTGPDGQADPRGYMMMSTASNIPVPYFIIANKHLFFICLQC